MVKKWADRHFSKGYVKYVEGLCILHFPSVQGTTKNAIILNWGMKCQLLCPTDCRLTNKKGGY